MVEEIVHSILEAEDKAEEIKKDAKTQAKKMIADAKLNSNQFREDYLKKNKSEIARSKEASIARSATIYDDIVKEGTQNAEKTIDGCNAKIDVAVKEIVRAILG